MNGIPRREAMTGNDGGKNQGKGEEETQAAREDHDGKKKKKVAGGATTGVLVEGPGFIYCNEQLGLVPATQHEVTTSPFCTSHDQSQRAWKY